MTRPKVFSILAMISLGIIVYSNTFFSSFHFDDDAYIVNDFAIRNIRNLIDIWNICPCRFITFLSIALNYHFNGLNVFGYHLFNLAIHLGTGFLVWWLTLLTFSTPAMKQEKIVRHAEIVALFTALIFVIHPIQVEAVTYIWQRAASMAAFFYLFSLCFYIKSRLKESVVASTAKQSPNIYYILSLLTAVLAMFTKENAITLPVMVLLYEVIFFKSRKNLNWVQLYPFWLSLFIIPLTMTLTKTARLGEIQTIVGGPHGISPIDYLLTQSRVMITYIRLVFLPLNLNLDYDYPIYKSFFEMPVLTSFLLLTAILYFAKRIFSTYRLISFSILWFFLTLLPESSIIPQTDVIFEHRLYLPLVGFCMFLVGSVYYLCINRSIKWVIIILSFFIACNSILTYQRNKIWKNEIVLWNDVLSKSPHKARPYINLGWAYYNQGDYTQAMSDYDKAIEISPEFVYSYDDKGLIYAKQGNYLQAISEYSKAISINPYYPKVYYHRGLVFFVQKNCSQALADFNKAIELDPEYVDAYNDRAKLYAQQGNLIAAKSDHERSQKIDPFL